MPQPLLPPSLLQRGGPTLFCKGWGGDQEKMLRVCALQKKITCCRQRALLRGCPLPVPPPFSPAAPPSSVPRQRQNWVLGRFKSQAPEDLLSLGCWLLILDQTLLFGKNRPDHWKSENIKFKKCKNPPPNEMSVSE